MLIDAEFVLAYTGDDGLMLTERAPYGVMLAITKGSFVIPLCVAGGFCFLGAFSYLVIVGKIEPLNRAEEEQARRDTRAPSTI